MTGLKRTLVPVVAAVVLLLGACGIDLDDAAVDPDAAATGVESQAGGAEEKTVTTKGPEDDVTVKKECKVGQFGMVEAQVSVKNSGKTDRSYLITISANDKDGNRVAELNGAANSIKPGQTAKVKTLGVAEDLKEGTVLTCEVADVTVV